MGDIGIARVLFAGDMSEEERRKGGGTAGSGGGTKTDIAFFFVSYTLIAAVTVFCVFVSLCLCVSAATAAVQCLLEEADYLWTH